MHVGLCTVSGADRPVETVVDTAADTGYDGVEIWGKDHVGDGAPATCRTLGDRVASHGLDLPVYGSYLRAGTDGFEAGVDDEVAVARHLDADLIRVWAGDVEYGDHDADSWRRIVEDLRTVTARASEAGLGVTVERHAGTVTDAATGATRVIEAVDRTGCGLNWQPDFRMDAGAVVADARRLAPIANNVHLQAVPECGASQRCPLADGYFDVSAVVDALTEHGYDRYLNVEFVDDDRPYRVAIEDDLRYLRSVLP